MLASCASTRKAARDAAKLDAHSGKGACVRRPFKQYATGTYTKHARADRPSLEQRQGSRRFFPDGIAFGRKGSIGTAVTAPAFSYMGTNEDGNERMVDLTGIEPVTS